MSVFDITTYTEWNYWWLVWAGNFLYLIFFIGIIMLTSGSRWIEWVSGLLGVPLVMVRSSKMGMLSGSHLLLSSLFIFILMSNLTGVFPYAVSVSSHLVYSFSFAFPFWLGLVMSSVVMGRIFTSVAKLVLSGLPLLAGGLLSWFELLSIFLRWITLSVRLSANMTIGQIMIGLLSQYFALSYFYSSSPWAVGLLVLVGCFVLVVEVAMCFLQAYVFCLLLGVYSGDHSL